MRILAAASLIPGALSMYSLFAASPAIKPDYGKLPLAFERQNEGLQTRYVARGNGYAIGLQDGALTLAIQPERGGPASVVSMEFVGSRKVPGASGKELPGKVNYIRGNDPSKWRLGLPTYERISYQGIYPRVDASGALVVGSAAGDVRLPLPQLYQDIGGSRRQ